MGNNKPFWIAVCWILVCTVSVARAETQWNFLVKAERDHQSFGDGNADLDTVTLSPSVQAGDWSITASLPWQHIEGTYFINNVYPNLAYLCQQVQSMNTLQKLLAISTGKVTPAQLSYCSNHSGVVNATQQDQVEGFGDFDIFVNYYLPLDSRRLTGSLGVGYTHDNGDVDKGLGTGTRDTYAETAWLLDLHPVSLLLTLGHDHVVNNDTAFDLKDHSYGSLDISWQLLDAAALGVEYHYQGSNSDALDDFDYTTGYLRLGRGPGWGARLFATDYHGQSGFPDQEYGASLSYLF